MTSSPFAPTSAAPVATGADDAFDVHVTMAMVMLLVVGGCLLALAGFLVLGGIFLAVVVFTIGMPQSPGDPPNEMMPVLALFEALFFLIPGALYAAAARGVWLRARWGWIAALIGFGLTFGGCCMPIGAYGFYALLREPQRKMFGF